MIGDRHGNELPCNQFCCQSAFALDKNCKHRQDGGAPSPAPGWQWQWWQGRENRGFLINFDPEILDSGKGDNVVIKMAISAPPVHKNNDSSLLVRQQRWLRW
jgi:hypothetical protein